MKHLLRVLIVALAMSLTTATAMAGGNKVTLCHAAGLDDTTQYVTLTIAYQAAFGQAGHFNEDGTPQAGHEADYLGACTEVTPSPTPTPTWPPSPEPSESPSATPEPTPSASPTPSATPSPSPTPEPTPSATPSESVMPSGAPNATPSVAPTFPAGFVLPPTDTEPAPELARLIAIFAVCFGAGYLVTGYIRSRR